MSSGLSYINGLKCKWTTLTVKCTVQYVYCVHTAFFKFRVRWWLFARGGGGQHPALSSWVRGPIIEGGSSRNCFPPRPPPPHPKSHFPPYFTRKVGMQDGAVSCGALWLERHGGGHREGGGKRIVRSWPHCPVRMSKVDGQCRERERERGEDLRASVFNAANCKMI